MEPSPHEGNGATATSDISGSSSRRTARIVRERITGVRTGDRVVPGAAAAAGARMPSMDEQEILRAVASSPGQTGCEAPCGGGTMNRSRQAMHATGVVRRNKMRTSLVKVPRCGVYEGALTKGITSRCGSAKCRDIIALSTAKKNEKSPHVRAGIYFSNRTITKWFFLAKPLEFHYYILPFSDHVEELIE